LPHGGALTSAREMAGESVARGTTTWTSASAAWFGPGDGGFRQRQSGRWRERRGERAGERLSSGGRRSGRGARGEASERDRGGRDSGGRECF
jgi:hypothetical protein